jgi:LEA14-like dessication related protein
MLRSIVCSLGKKTQTRSSAFFCFHRSRSGLIAAALTATIICSSSALPLEEKKPAIHLKGVSIERIDWDKRVAQASLTILIDNPGPAFRLKDLDYLLKLNDRKAAQGSYEKEIGIPAGSSETFSLPCDIDLNAAPGVVWGIIIGGFEVHYELETEFTLPLPMLNPRIKTSLAGDLSLAATVSGWSARIKERVSNK